VAAKYLATVLVTDIIIAVLPPKGIYFLKKTKNLKKKNYSTLNTGFLSLIIYIGKYNSGG
jgi:hypothetical protein